MQVLRIGKYIITKPILEILYDLQATLTNGKLRDIKPDTENIVVSCPVHSDGLEDSPDCNIYIGNDNDVPFAFVRCFACEFKGSFDKFVSECFNSSLEFAQNWLIKNYGELSSESIILAEPIRLYKQKVIKKLDKSELSKYQSWCPYFQQRKITREVCEEFNLKYDPIKRQVIFPVYDTKDNLIMLAKRSVYTKFFHMTEDVEKPVYCLNYIIKHNYSTTVICEGLFDCMTAYSYGFPAIATLGSISDYQIEQINKSCISTLYICMDNDESGRKFTQFLKDKLAKRILIITVQLPQGKKDINDCSRDEFIKCLETAKNKF